MQQRSCTFNLITLLFLALTFLVILTSIGWMTDTLPVPEAIAPVTKEPFPTLIALSLWTPSHTPTPSDTPLPTQTPSASPTREPTATQTPRPTATDTLIPSDTPLPTETATITPPPASATWTPSATFTASFTATSSATMSLTPTATGATATRTPTFAPFPFQVETLFAGKDLDQKCDFQGFAGVVVDSSGSPVFGVRIAVIGAGLPPDGVTVEANSNPIYGLGGWEMRVSPTVNTHAYTVQLESADGTPLSYPVDYAFPGTCEQNVLFINFRQDRPF